MSARMPLDQALRLRFKKIRLSQDQLSRLPREARIPERAGRPRRSAALGAAMILAALFAGWAGGRFYESRMTEALLGDIAAEAAENHLKLKPLDVEGDDLTAVLAYFAELDFLPQPSSGIVADTGDRLLGGRYCSVQGITAAQLRVAHRDGSLSTWYQASLPPESMQRIPALEDGAEPAEIVTRGIRVAIWREKGVLFVEASPAARDD